MSEVRELTAEELCKILDDIPPCITDILIEVGITPNLRGYQYLCTAIIATVKNPTLCTKITKLLYPYVASIYKVPPTRVERAIRHAIGVACERGDPVLMEIIFKHNIQPTNGEFISTIAYKYRRMIMEQLHIHSEDDIKKLKESPILIYREEI